MATLKSKKRSKEGNLIPYYNFNSLLERKSIQSLEANQKELITSLIKTARDNAVDKYITYNEIYSSVEAWESSQKKYKYGEEDAYAELHLILSRLIKTIAQTYTSFEKNRLFQKSIIEKRYELLKKRTIPISYAIFAGLFFALTCVFATMLIVNIITKVSLINFWYLIMLFAGSLGLFVTAIVATKEWRNKINEEKTKNSPERKRK